MARTTSGFEQVPRWDIGPDQETTLTLAAHLDALAEWGEKLRRRLMQLIPHYHYGTATYDPANLVDGAGVTTTVAVDGAELGQVALATFSLDLQGITLTAWVSAADVVSVRFQNETGGAIDLGSGTLTAWTVTPPSVV